MRTLEQMAWLTALVLMGRARSGPSAATPTPSSKTSLARNAAITLRIGSPGVASAPRRFP